MVLRIHDLTYTGKAHISTSWYLVDDTSINTYLTSSAVSNVNSTVDLLFWAVDVSSEIVPLSVIVLKHFDDGSEEKIGPISVYDGQSNLVTYVLTDSPVETPTIKLLHNSFVNGIGEIAFRSSTIRPTTAIMSEVVWYIRDAMTGKYIYNETSTTTYDLILDTTKLDLSNIDRLDILCCHKGSNSVISGFAVIAQEVNTVDITLKNNFNISPDLPYPLSFSSLSATNLVVTSVNIYNKNNEIVFSSINDIPIGTLLHNESYSLVATFDVTLNGTVVSSRKVFALKTVNPDKRRDVSYLDTVLLEYKTLTTTADKSLSYLIKGDIMVDTVVKNSTQLMAYDIVTNKQVDVMFISSIALAGSRVEIVPYNKRFSYVSNYVPVNNNITVERFPIDNLYLHVRPISTITLTSDSSNVDVASHNEIYFILNGELVKADALGITTVITSLPAVSHSVTSIADYRVHLINDTELYVITNTNAILLINLISLEIDILNSFVRGSDAILSAVTSNGGLLIVDDMATHLYDRASDTVTTTIEVIKSLVIADNNLIYKVS